MNHNKGRHEVTWRLADFSLLGLGVRVGERDQQTNKDNASEERSMRNVAAVGWSLVD